MPVVILLAIPKLYRDHMSDVELYEATRCTWEVSEEGRQAELAMAVSKGIVREVYRIKRWCPAGTLVYQIRKFKFPIDSSLWEFEGEVAIDVRDQYVDQPAPVRNYGEIAYMNI